MGQADNDQGPTVVAVDGRRWRRRRQKWWQRQARPETVMEAVAESDGDGGCNEQPYLQERATTAVGAAGSVTRVHEVQNWVDLTSRTEPNQGERSKVETQEWRLGAITVSPSFPVFLFLDSTPF